MKKFFIFISVVIALIALLPLVGNSLTETLLDSNIENLKSRGLDLTESQRDSSYITTKRHYEFKVESSSQLNALGDKNFVEFFKDMVVGVDVEYSNIPMMKDVKVDIYPLRFSKKTKKLLQERDSDFYNTIESFLQKRGLLYHLNYNLVSRDFNGYLKNIEEHYLSKDAKRFSLRVMDFHYKGRGDLKLQSFLDYTLSHLLFEYSSRGESVAVEVRELISQAKSESSSSYSTNNRAKKIFLRVKGAQDSIFLDAKDAVVNISSTRDLKESLYLKVATKELNTTQKDESFSLKDFNSEIELTGVDSEIVEKLRATSKRSKKALVMQLLSKGLTLNILEFNAENLILKDGKKLGAFTLKSALKLKQDSTFAMKATLMPPLLLQDIDLELRVKLSDKIFLKAMDLYPMLSFIKSYSKDVGSSIVYDVSFIDGGLKLNGKRVY